MLRNSKVLTAWLNGTNPVVNPALSESGVLTFENAAERAGVSTAAQRYTVEWLRFDNATGAHEAVGTEATVTEPRAQAPVSLVDAKPRFIAARVRALHESEALTG